MFQFPVRRLAIAALFSLGLGAINLVEAQEFTMSALTTNPLGIAAVESLDLAMNKKDIDAAVSYLAEPYIQHNPKAPSGIEAARMGMTMLAKAFPDRVVEFKRVLVDGDLVVIAK